MLGRPGGVDLDSRLIYWYFGAPPATMGPVIRANGAPSISMGRTPHEVRDEMCPARSVPAA